MIDPEYGDLIVVKTGGLFARVIRFGQWLRWRKLDDGRAWHFNHVAVYTGDNTIIEARPTGVRFSNLGEYSRISCEVVRLQGDPQKCVDEAMKWIGTPYGWLDIVAFFFLSLGLNPKWVDRICRDAKTVVCSQLGALSAAAGGDSRFNDPYLALPVTIAAWAEYRKLV
jgi:hypothetical protein